jgi:hypothetical protein
MNTIAAIAVTALITLTTPEYPEYAPNQLCIASQCNAINYFYGNGVMVAEALINSEVFIGYLPACYIDCENYALRTAYNLEANVRKTYPKARLSYF